MMGHPNGMQGPSGAEIVLTAVVILLIVFAIGLAIGAI